MKKPALSLSFLIAMSTVLTLISGLIVPAAAAEEDPIDVSSTVSTELPALFADGENGFELEDLYTEDSNGCLHNRSDDGLFDYYYLKGDPETAYMSFHFEVEKEGTYEVCIGLMGIFSTVPRSAELNFNGERRYYVEQDYRNIPEGVLSAEYVSGITAYLRKGSNTLTVYLGRNFDNVNMKSLFFDKFFLYRTGDLPIGYEFPDVDESEKMDITGAVPERILFNKNFSSLVTSTVFCTAGYVNDEEKGEVLELTATEDLEPFRFAFSYRKYMKALGNDPDAETCDDYPFLVLSIKADETLADGMLDFFYFTAGNDFVDYGRRVTTDFKQDGTWQYILFEMDMESDWYADFDGGSFFIGGEGSAPGTKVRIADLSLFGTYEEAARYAGIMADEETATDVTDTDAPPQTPETEAPSTETRSDKSTENITDTASKPETELFTESAGTGCSSVLGSSSLLYVVPVLLIPIRRKKH